MTCGQSLGPFQQRLNAISPTTQYEWMTGWMPAIGLDKLKAVLRNSAVSGNFQSRLALQVAEIRTDAPSAPVLLEASYLQGAGERCSGDLTISSNTQGNFFVRLGVAYSIHTGTIPAAADVGMELAYDACGQIVGGATLDLVTPGTTSRYAPVTGWIPAIHAGKVKAVIVVTNAIGNFQAQLATRTAVSSQQVTTAWSTNFEGSWHSGNGEFATGELTTSLASVMWVQFGLEHSLSSGSDGGAQVDCAVAARRS